MSLMGKPPPPLPFSEMCKAWDEPSQSWIDYFLQKDGPTNVLRVPSENQEIIAVLTMQYVEQTIVLEKDLASLRKRTTALTEASDRSEMETDVQYLHYKKSLTWLYTMACFSAIEWNFEKLLDEKKQNAHLVRYLIEKTSECILSSNKENLINFSQLLHARFCLYINKKMRIPPPAGKPQTNNPNAQEDKGIILAMNHRKAIYEIRERCKDAASELEKMLLEVKTRKVEVPSIETFLAPFLEHRNSYLSIGLIGKDLTLDGSPMPDFSLINKQISETEIMNILRYELACHYFQLLKFEDARKYFEDITTNLPVVAETSAICFIDRAELDGYLVAVKLTQINTAKVNPVEKKPQSYDDLPKRQFWITRELSATQSPGPFFKTENLARDTIDEIPFFPSTAFRDFQPDEFKDYFRAVKRLLESNRKPTSIRSFLFYISALVPNFTEQAQVYNFDAVPLRKSVTITPPPHRIPPQASVISDLLASESLYWRLLTTFDVNTVKYVYNQIAQTENGVVVPKMFKYSENLAEIVLADRNANPLYAILLGKLEQLAALQDILKWKEFLNGVVQQIPVLASNADRMLKEAVNVQTRALNRCLQNTHRTVDANTLRNHVNLAKNSIQNQRNNFATDSMIESVAFLLNVGEGAFVLTDIPQTTADDVPYLILAKFLAAWGQVLSQSQEIKLEFIASFSHFIDQKGIFTMSANRDDETAKRRADKRRSDLLTFIKLLTEQEQLSLLISYLCHLYNRHLLTTDRQALALDFQYRELWKNGPLPNAHEDFIDSVLLEALNVGLRLNPMNAFWLRSLADFHYTKSKTDDALLLYMETLCACTDNQLMPPFPEVLLNDLMWYRMRVCLTAAGMHTLAALVTQLISMTGHKLEQYSAATQNILSQAVLDASDSLAYFCYDHQLTETLTNVFEQMGLQNKTDVFIQMASHPALNVSNTSDVVQNEKSRRIKALFRFLASMIFEIHH